MLKSFDFLLDVCQVILVRFKTNFSLTGILYGYMLSKVYPGLNTDNIHLYYRFYMFTINKFRNTTLM